MAIISVFTVFNNINNFTVLGVYFRLKNIFRDETTERKSERIKKGEKRKKTGQYKK